MREIPLCVACGSGDLLPALDLGRQPLANAFHFLEEEPESYPLLVKYCGACTHLQLSVAVPPQAMFEHYPYSTGVSETARQHFQKFAQELRKKYGHGARVLDIASNDGTFLEELEKVGLNAVGVDPAGNLVEKARAKGLTVHHGYWCEEVAAQVGLFDVITVMNVLAHTDNPLQFLLTCRKSLKPGGSIYVQTSQIAWLENGEFDCVYHEHISYFTWRSLTTLARRAGYEVEDVGTLSIHGCSRRVQLTDRFEGIGIVATESALAGQRCLQRLRSEGYAVWGYGAAAKGNTRLNAGGLALDAIADDTPEKIGLFSPGLNIPIVNPQWMAGVSGKMAIVLLSWNFGPEIAARALKIREGLETIFIDPRTWTIGRGDGLAPIPND